MFERLFKAQAYEPFQPSEVEPPQPRQRPESAGTLRPLPPAPGVAPGTSIRYHPDLIQRFEGHHASLLKTFEAVKTHAAQDEFAQAQASLRTFQRVLTSHLLEENIKLYTYLSRCLAEDPNNRDLMRAMKLEMAQIGTGVTRFVNQFTVSGINPANKRPFLEQLDAVGATLKERIEREETSLYTMYMPPDAFQ